MTSADLTVLEPYCKDNMRLLKKLSKSIFLRLNEPLTEADYDDFYSIANMTLWQCYNSYSTDKVLSFKLDAPSPCRLDAPDLDLICYASADCLHQHLQVI